MKKYLFLLFIFSLSCRVPAQWVQISNGMGIERGVTSLAHNGNYLFAGTVSGVYRNVNDIWSRVGFANKEIHGLVALGGIIFAGVEDSGICVSSNNGTNWSKTPFMYPTVNCLYVDGGKLYTATNQGGFYVSSDYGNNWNAFLTNEYIFSVTAEGSVICAGGFYRVSVSSNNGISWNSTDLTGDVASAKIKGSYIFIGLYGNGLLVSTNFGLQWQSYAADISTILSYAFSGNNLLVGKSNNPSIAGGVYLTTNYGYNWINLNQGFNGLPAVSSLLILNDYIYAGAITGNSNYLAVWKRPLSEILEVNNLQTTIPLEFELHQNFPNPFNPSTNIKFSIPENGKVKTENNFVVLKVYNLLGREVATLVNEHLEPGTYSVTFDGSELSSGVYYYKLTAGSYSETRKMVLIK